MQQTEPSTLHQCFDEYVFPDFYQGVTLTVQDLTETVGHSKSEKRFYHIMMDGTNAMNLMQAIATDYLRTFYYPLQRLRDSNERSLYLPELDPDEMGWLPLLQGSLLSALTYYAQAEERAQKPLGSPTCTPHMLVLHPDKENTVLYAAIMPALHVHTHPEPPAPPTPPAPEKEEKPTPKTHDHSSHIHARSSSSDGGQ